MAVTPKIPLKQIDGVIKLAIRIISHLFLVQKSLETGEKEPTPAKLRELVNQANQDKVKTIFIQPEFPASGAKRVAEAIGGRCVTLSVLEYDVPANMRKTTALLAESFEE